jgi:hypothetical protein|uniref:WLM domain-containing protein n=1 Tax=viral metagenome TaxID=1070528 RepID=A0A6C0BMS6_9ZZZZ
MLQVFIAALITFMVAMILKIHWDNHHNEVDLVISQIDHKHHLVRNLPDKEHAADLLAQIEQRIARLMTYLHDKYPKDVRVSRLLEKFDSNQISESSADSLYTSYSVNKGEKLVFCLRQKDSQEALHDLNTMIFVAIHELAHIMTQSVGHTREFWDNMRFLLETAMSSDVAIYQYQSYHTDPQPYCGMTISDTPLKK